MALTCGQLIDRVNKKIHNSKSKIGGDDGIMAILNEANRKLHLDINFISLKRTASPILVFKNIYEYPLPVDISYDQIIQAYFEADPNNSAQSQFEMTIPKFLFNARNPYNLNSYMATYGYNYGEINPGSFNTVPNNPIQVMAVEFEDGQPYFNLRIVQQQAQAEISNCDTFNGNGMWVASGDATNVRSDNQRYKEGNGSVAFNSSGVLSDVTVTNSTLNAVDISNIANKGKVTWFAELPTTVPNSITMRIGSSATDYYEQTVTVKQNGLQFIPGWNLLSINLETATTVGSPVDTAITYCQITFTNTVAYAGTYRIDAIWARFGKECTLKYYSKYPVISDAGVRKENFTATDDITLLQQEEVDILIEEATIMALQNEREFNEANNRIPLLDRAKKQYLQKYPEQEEVQSFSYYI